jgi:uncharacterized membrane protein YfcA
LVLCAAFSAGFVDAIVGGGGMIQLPALLDASAGARTINVATNAGALLFFGVHGEVQWVLGTALGVGNTAGSVLGAHTAVKHGSKFVRVIFLVIVIALIAKTGADPWGF